MTLKHKLSKQLHGKRFDINPITPYEVKKIIDNLDIRKTTGIDGVGPRVLKACSDSVTIAIASIINNNQKWYIS